MKIIKMSISLMLGISLLMLVIYTLPAVAATPTNATQAEVEQTAETAVALITEYPIPGENGQPRSIVVQSPGHVWFTMPAIDQIGELIVTTTTDYQFVTYNLAPNSEPYDITYDGNAIWFTQRANDKIGRLDLTTKAITEYDATADSAPSGIVAAPNGDIWFVERDSRKLGVLKGGNPPIQYPYTYPRDGAQLEDITTINSDSIWFTAPGVNRAVEFTPSKDDITQETVVGTFGAAWAPGDITIGRNNPWVTAPSEGLYGLYAPGTQTLWRWRTTLTNNSQPTGIAFSTLNGIDHIWVVQTNSGRVGQLLTTLAGGDILYREYALPTPNSQPRGIAIDANNHAWITESGSNKIAEWRSPYFHNVYLPLIQR